MVWPSAFLVSTINLNSIDSGSGNGVVHRSPALLAPILAAVMLIFLAFFAGFTNSFIGGGLKSGQSSFFVVPGPKFLGFRIFF